MVREFYSSSFQCPADRPFALTPFSNFWFLACPFHRAPEIIPHEVKDCFPLNETDSIVIRFCCVFEDNQKSHRKRFAYPSHKTIFNKSFQIFWQISKNILHRNDPNLNIKFSFSFSFHHKKRMKFMNFDVAISFAFFISYRMKETTPPSNPSFFGISLMEFYSKRILINILIYFRKEWSSSIWAAIIVIISISKKD